MAADGAGEPNENEAPTVPTNARVWHLVDRLFRRETRRPVSVLTRIFCSGRIDLADDVVQEAFGMALQHWPYRGVPDNPAGWLARVARNRALDILRSVRALLRATEEIGRLLPPNTPGPALESNCRRRSAWFSCR